MSKTLIALLLAICISCLTIFFKYTSIPANLSWDELEFARLALSLNKLPYQVYSSLASGHATIYFYILNLFLSLFGVHTWALRLPAALFGIVDVILLFTLFKLVFKKTSFALAGALLLATNRWFITFARFSFEATFLLFLELSSLVLLYMYFKYKYTCLLWISAIFSGLTFHSYITGRLFILLPVLRLYLQKKTKQSLIYAAIAVVIMIPLIIYLLQHPDIRIQQVSVFHKGGSFWDGVMVIGENFKKTVGMFFWSGDSNGRHNFPFKVALNPIQLLLAGTGIVFMLRRWRDKDCQLFLVWLVLAIIPTLLTVPEENPNMLRTFTVLPSIIYAMVLCIKVSIGSRSVRWRTGIAIGFCLLIVAAQLYDLRVYFQFQSRVSRNAFEISCPLETVIQYKAKTLGEIPAKCRVGNNMF